MDHTFEKLHDFIAHRMRMSHVYQPVMLRCLLLNGGRATKTQIAADILARDPSQVEYYENVVTRMVGRVLTGKDGVVSRDHSDYQLVGADGLREESKAELVALCDAKIVEYEARRGQRLWDHRRRMGKIVSGSLRYEVLKRARYRCELCGVSAEEKAIEVDHILPKNRGGSDEILNLQALCYSCNASKRDRDDTDFRDIADSYRRREDACPFCDIDAGRIIAENSLAVAIRDAFPVTPGHTLLLPKRHAEDYFELGQAEINAINELVRAERRQLSLQDPTVSGFNIGANCGAAAGQTIFHSHLHLIPRRVGDVDEPRGGIRHTLPGKGFY